MVPPGPFAQALPRIAVPLTGPPGFGGPGVERRRRCRSTHSTYSGTRTRPSTPVSASAIACPRHLCGSTVGVGGPLGVSPPGARVWIGAVCRFHEVVSFARSGVLTPSFSRASPEADHGKTPHLVLSVTSHHGSLILGLSHGPPIAPARAVRSRAGKTFGSGQLLRLP
jgi:hypothetical protein